MSLLKESFGDLDRILRIYTYHTGAAGTHAFELEYTDLADYEQSPAEWLALPENTEAQQRFAELVQWIKTEFWTLD